MKTRRFKRTETPPLGIKCLAVRELKAGGRFCAIHAVVALGLFLLMGSITVRADVAQADSADFTLNTTGLSEGSGGVAQGDSPDFTLDTTGVSPGIGGTALADSPDFTLDTTGISPGRGGAAQGDSADFTLNTTGISPGIRGTALADSPDFTLDTTGVLPGIGGIAQADSADFTLDTRTLKVLLSFTASGGANPYAGLFEGSDGALYGTTSRGGIDNNGTVFKLNNDGSGYTMLHSFDSANLDGSRPYAGVVEGSDGTLYGMTPTGGNEGEGTVFRLSKDGSGYGILHHFSPTTGDGHEPYGALVEGGDGALYGTTVLGGNDNSGTVFRLSKDGSDYSVLHRFSDTGDGGRAPYPGLIRGSDGALYGVADEGSRPYNADNVGSVFKLNENGTGFTVLHNFRDKGGDGSLPNARLLESSDGALYGTTESGGTAGSGTAFRLNKDGSGYVVLRSFGGAGDGAYPDAGLAEGIDGALYGVTGQGGVTGAGVVFRMRKDGSAYAVLYQFSGGDGANPWYAALVKGSDGALYGTTYSGGDFNLGVVFRLAADPLVLPRPALTSITLVGPNLVLSGGNGISGATYYVMMSPNGALPLSQWTPVWTNVLGASGNFTITLRNALDTSVAHRFYILKQP